MKLPYTNEEYLRGFIQNALKEDIGEGTFAGDHSSLGSIAADATGKAALLIKGEGVLAGVEMARLIFQEVDSTLEMSCNFSDGDQVTHGDIGFEVSGSVRSILMAERLVLNCMQRMSGIATKTNHLARMIAHTQAKLLDTRKTTPNFRVAEKWAVRIGGGQNHRFGLYDMIMLKDNHIDSAGGIEKAIGAAQAYQKKHGLQLKIEVETRTLSEVAEVLKVGGVDTIMLDNMPPELMKNAVEMIGHQYITEASGGITEQTIVDVATSGVDFISVGALTHSYESMDISLKIVK